MLGPNVRSVAKLLWSKELSLPDFQRQQLLNSCSMPPQDRRFNNLDRTEQARPQPGHRTVSNEQPYGSAILVVATTCLALGFCANIMVSVFMKPFEQEFGWPRADISMAYSVLTVGAAIAGIVWGGLSQQQDRRKADRYFRCYCSFRRLDDIALAKRSTDASPAAF